MSEQFGSSMERTQRAALFFWFISTYENVNLKKKKEKERGKKKAK